MIRRREFIAGLGGAAASWPVLARAQQGDPMRRIGVLGGRRSQLLAFTQVLAGLGWTDGRNVRMDPRWGGADINRISSLPRQDAKKPRCYGTFFAFSGIRNQAWKRLGSNRPCNEKTRSYASWCINRRADGGLELPLKVVQTWLDHASIQITADRYGHLFPSSDGGSELAAAEKALMR
jgi:integrase